MAVSSEEVDGLFCTGILKCEDDEKCKAACKADGFKGGVCDHTRHCCCRSPL